MSLWSAVGPPRRPRCTLPPAPLFLDFLTPAWSRLSSNQSAQRTSGLSAEAEGWQARQVDPPRGNRNIPRRDAPPNHRTPANQTASLKAQRTSPLAREARAVLDPAQRSEPWRFKYPKQMEPYRTILPPRASKGMRELHAAAMDFVRRGLTVADALSPNPKPSTPSLQTLRTGFAPDEPIDDPFQTAVVKGYGESLRLGLGLEFSHPREMMTGLVDLVRRELSKVHDRGGALSPKEWAAAKAVLVQAGTRPTIESVGEWAWEELERGSSGWTRLFEVWQGVHEVIPKRREQMLKLDANVASLDSARRSLPGRPVPLNARFFTALIAGASALDSTPPLATLVYSLVTNIASFVSLGAEESEPDPTGQHRCALDTLPDPARARYYIRAVELASLFQSPLSAFGVRHVPKRPKPGKGRVVTDLEHILKRAGAQHETAYLTSMWRRIKEAVDGGPGVAEGWLAVEWHEPVMQLSAADPNTAQVEEVPHIRHLEGDQLYDTPDAEPSLPEVKIVLTQTVLGTLLTSLGQGGQWDVAIEIADWLSACRPNGSPALKMSLYLWSCLLRGLASKGEPELAERAYRRMIDQDHIEPDVIVDCSLLRAYLAQPRAKRNANDPPLPEDAFARGLEKANDFLNSPEINVRYHRRPPIAYYNTVLSALMTNGMYDRARAMLDEILEMGHKPNTITFNHFLAAHARRSTIDFNAIAELAKMMKQQNVKPDVATFATLLNIMLRHKDKDVSRLLLPMMAERSLQANVVVYGSLIHHLSKTGKREDLETALKLLNAIEARAKGKSNEIVYTSLIMGFLRAHRRSEDPSEMSTELRVALALVERMKRSHIKLNRIGSHALIHTLLETRTRAGTALALELFEELREDRRRNDAKVHPTSYVILLENLLKNGETTLARKYATQAREDKVVGAPWFDRLVQNSLLSL